MKCTPREDVNAAFSGKPLFTQLLYFDVITVSAEDYNYPFNKQSTAYLIFEVLRFTNYPGNAYHGSIDNIYLPGVS